MGGAGESPLGEYDTLWLRVGDFAKWVLPWKRLLIAPATENYAGAAVHAALAMIARVIAMEHNGTTLSELKVLALGRVETIVMSKAIGIDIAVIAKHGPVDAFQDFTPPIATNISHVQARADLKTKGVFKLEEGIAAFESAVKEAGAGKAVYFVPNQEYFKNELYTGLW